MYIVPAIAYYSFLIWKNAIFSTLAYSFKFILYLDYYVVDTESNIVPSTTINLEFSLFNMKLIIMLKVTLAYETLHSIQNALPCEVINY